MKRTLFSDEDLDLSVSASLVEQSNNTMIYGENPQSIVILEERYQDNERSRPVLNNNTFWNNDDGNGLFQSFPVH